MSLFRPVQLCAVLAILAGCRSTQHQAPVSAAPGSARAVMTAASVPGTAVEQPIASPVAFQEPLPPTPSAAWESDPLVGGESELSLPRLVEQVQARNPTLQAMIAAWRAAAQRYPQVVALDDPMFSAIVAPASFDSLEVESAYALEGAQKIPWFGKRAARGRVALSEASAAGLDAQQTRVLLAEAAQVAFLDYYLVDRQQDLNRRNIEVLRQFRESAQAKYRANQVTQRDVIQADVELTALDRRKIELERMTSVAVARINTLLRRPADAPLPPPPAQLPTVPLAIDLDVLQQIASQQRPDLAANAARVRAEQAVVTLARKDYFPDGELFGRYDTFWQPADTQGDLRGQVGVRLNVPIYRGRLNAAVREAMFRLSQRRAEYDQKLLDVQYEVQSAYAQLDESRKSLALYTEKLLPLAEQNVAAARANYDVGKESFLDLAIVQRQLIDVREKQQEAIALYLRRLAELRRVVGGSLPDVQANVEELPPPRPK